MDIKEDKNEGDVLQTQSKAEDIRANENYKERSKINKRMIFDLLLLAAVICVLAVLFLPSQRVKRALKTAEKNAEQGLYEDTIAEYEKAIEIDSDCFEAYWGLAKFYYDCENWNEAITSCESALRVDPNYADCYALLAESYASLGDITKALDLLKERDRKTGKPIETVLICGQEYSVDEEELEFYLYMGGSADILYICYMKELKNLYITGFHNPPLDNIEMLSELTNLEFLVLDKCSISNISPLKDLKNLKHLQLQNNSISDISPLKNLTNLEKLYLGGNDNISYSDLVDLKYSLPNCDIYY